MPKTQKNGQRQCEICSFPVKTLFGLAEHCLKTGHQADQCCQQCVKWFGSKQSLAQHKGSKHGKSWVAVPSRLLSVSETGHDTGSFPVLKPYSFRDQEHKYLVLPDTLIIYDRLVPNCHSQERLRREGYVLPDDLNGKVRVAKKSATNLEQSIPTPGLDPLSPKRKAVAFDCEMVRVQGGTSEVVSICIVDLFTGHVLTNSLVKPREPIVDWRSHIHGITPATLSIAVARGLALDGWEAVREELWKNVDEDTVIVGQSLQHDLKALRIVHARIVDTAILTADAVFGKNKRSSRRWSLQSLCEELLHLRIRQGSGVHDALEDTMAARELTLWCICYPIELQEWANKARKSIQVQRQSHVKRNRGPKTIAQRITVNRSREEEGHIHQYSRRDDEILRWEDVVEWDVWPKSPPDSD